MTAPAAQRIDAHQHFWRYDASEYDWIDDSMTGLRRDFLPAEAQTEMAAAGFDGCIAVQARQTLDETRWLLALADAHPVIAGVVGWVDLRATDARQQLELFADHPKLVGIRHIVQTEPDHRFMLVCPAGTYTLRTYILVDGQVDARFTPTETSVTVGPGSCT